eukprot:6203369-Pleurochrysis_carterae.AAC.1
MQVRRAASDLPAQARSGERHKDHIGHHQEARGSVKQKRKGIIVEGTTTFKQGYNSSQMAQLVGVLGLVEQRSLAKRGRGASQLAMLGKLRHNLKLGGSSVPCEVRSLLPEAHPYTCLSVFESILRGEVEPLYSLSGDFRGAASSAR